MGGTKGVVQMNKVGNSRLVHRRDSFTIHSSTYIPDQTPGLIMEGRKIDRPLNIEQSPLANTNTCISTAEGR
jgi:hypothetical protein